jgi:glucosylglycerate synthase
MATTTTIPENTTPSPGSPTSGLLVSLSALSAEALEATLANLAAAFPDQLVNVVIPTPAPAPASASNLSITTYTPAITAPGSWILTAADYLNTHKQMQDHKSTGCILLGPEAQSLAPESLRALATSIAAADLTTPHYSLGAREGLVNSVILYPVTRALFGTRPRYPLAIDLALSARMSEHLAACGQRLAAAKQPGALVWPVAEAATAGFSLAEVPDVSRALPPPDATDLNSLLALVAGSFFGDLDLKASFWQRTRLAYPPKAAPPGESTPPQPAAHPGDPDKSTEQPDVQPMLDSFRLAYSNLHEIWSLVLPPNSLLGLKKLSLMPPSAFRMPDSLWARIVYDFVLAYRLRTINRGHLLGALTPLYLAWVASHLLLTSGAAAESITPENHIEALAAAFETDKPYLVARWRWPDRFNP